MSNPVSFQSLVLLVHFFFVIIACKSASESKTKDIGLSPANFPAPQAVMWLEDWKQLVHYGMCPPNTIEVSRKCEGYREVGETVPLADFEKRLKTRILGARSGAPVSYENTEDTKEFLLMKIKRLKQSLETDLSFEEKEWIKNQILKYEAELKQTNQVVPKKIEFTSAEDDRIRKILENLIYGNDVVFDEGQELYNLARDAFFGNFNLISAGTKYSCGISVNKKLYCWGTGESGQIGRGFDLIKSMRAVELGNGNSTFIQVDSGESHACALTKEGRTFCWGEGGKGQLGYGGLENKFEPVEIQSDLRFASISLGNFHSCALTSEGKAYCWGEGKHGQLGNSGAENKLQPEAVTSEYKFKALSAGGMHTCGLTMDNRAFCWGNSRNGQLGGGNAKPAYIPQAVKGNYLFTMISAGDQHTCALVKDGKAYCWGSGNTARLGSDYTRKVERFADDALEPKLVKGDVTFTSIEAGNLHTCALTSLGQAYCWGFGLKGQLGTGDKSNRIEPVKVRGDLAFTSIAAGYDHTCGILGMGIAYCWGESVGGQLGIDINRIKGQRDTLVAIPTIVEGFP